MLRIFPSAPNPTNADITAAVWLDLLHPSADELAVVEAAVGHALPTRRRLRQVESSRRLSAHAGAIYMSTPSAAPHGGGVPVAAPIGFVLSKARLITVRFSPSPAFDAVARGVESGDLPASTGAEVFALLCEEVVERIGDELERLAEELGALSVAAFHQEESDGRAAIKANRLLRVQLRQVGRLGDRLSEVRDGLLGLGRIVAYAEQNGGGWTTAEVKARLASVRADIASLSDYEEHLAGKVQFVLDALVGLIGIAQNDIFKVLTIVSIVGIPPTQIAGVYGMNFKNMPEYNWAWGYQYGWAVIILSAVIPLVWFKVRGWF